MDKLDYAILNLLQEQQATSKLKAITIHEILDEMSINEKTLARRIKKIVESGNAAEGFKVGRAFSYYITLEGVKRLEEAMK